MTPEVVDILVANHRRFLAFLEARTGSREAAEDILQDAVVRSLRSGGEALDSESVVAWFYRVLRNALTDRWRRLESERRTMAQITATTDESGEHTDPQLLDTVCACVSSLLGTLRPDYADLLRRVDLEEQSIAEAATGAGITLNNAYVRLHRARRALRHRVESSCGTCAIHGCLACDCGGGGAKRPR